MCTPRCGPDGGTKAGGLTIIGRLLAGGGFCEGNHELLSYMLSNPDYAVNKSSVAKPPPPPHGIAAGESDPIGISETSVYETCSWVPARDVHGGRNGRHEGAVPERYLTDAGKGDVGDKPGHRRHNHRRQTRRVNSSLSGRAAGWSRHPVLKLRPG